MDRNSVFIGWVAGGIGVVLFYSAYTNHSPIAALKAVLNGEHISSTPTLSGALSPDSGSGSATNNLLNPSTTGSGRPAQLKARVIQPNLVSVGSQPGLQLDSDAATSFARVEAAYGQKIPLSGTFRSYAQQAIEYAQHPNLFAPPGTSLHEVGLALDIDQSFNLDDPKLIAAFQQNGWFRQGKTINWKGQTRPEPWHWSYGVAG